MNQVDWHDGLLLTPEIFKQQEKYFQWQINQCLQLISPFYWGFRTLEIDHQNLAYGTLTIKNTEGIFKDACYFKIVNISLDLHELKLSTNYQTLYLCKDLEKNTIYLSSECSNTSIGLPICKIHLHQSLYEIDANYIPPCICISAHPRISETLQSTIQTIQDINIHCDIERQLLYLRRHSFLHPIELHKVTSLLSNVINDVYLHHQLNESIIKPLIAFNQQAKKTITNTTIYFIKSGSYWQAEINLTSSNTFIDLYIKLKNPANNVYFKLSDADKIDKIVKLSLRGMPHITLTQAAHQTLCYRFERSALHNFNHTTNHKLALHINDEVLAERPWICICS